MAASESSRVGDVARAAVRLSRSPLGIIGLFIVLIYGVAGLVLGFGGAALDCESVRVPLVWFLIVFPTFVFTVFVWLVVKHQDKIFGPVDFGSAEDFIRFVQLGKETSRRVSILEEVSPVAIDAPPPTPEARAAAPANADDPQKGRWGGKRASRNRVIGVGRIRSLRYDNDYYRIPLEVRSTDPANHPLTGSVTFHLHPTFDPDVQVVEARNGVARLELVSYGAFTVGAATDEGATLEIDLADADIDAPEAFKTS
ncbi:MAG: hypothetical protein HY049_08345 [Acidobacteria bacterium]|nr:hypothetical protein [Acidobacteriota bacterium]